MILLSKTKARLVALEDTRSILLLPCLSKIYEKCFFVHLRRWVEEQGILPEEQSGFRPGHNMAVRLDSLVDQIGQSLLKNTAAAALFIDFKTAFNQLWYHGLWLKLTRLGCPLEIISWLQHYLTERSAYIEIKGARSSTFSLHKGVPQGSCIGPVLFILFHHDILDPLTILHWRHLFADDLSILFAPSSMLSSASMIHTLTEQITDVLNRLIKYSFTCESKKSMSKKPTGPCFIVKLRPESLQSRMVDKQSTMSKNSRIFARILMLNSRLPLTSTTSKGKSTKT